MLGHFKYVVNDNSQAPGPLEWDFNTGLQIISPVATLKNMSVSGRAGGNKKSHPGGREFFFFS